MKYKVTVSQALPSTAEGYQEFETVYLQVLDLDENPAADIARLLNPEPEYEEEQEESDQITIEGNVVRIPESLVGQPVTVDLPRNFGLMKDEEPAPKARRKSRPYNLNQVIDAFERGDSTKQIADDQSVTYTTIYQLRRKYEEGNLERETEDESAEEEPKQEPVEPVETDYSKSRARLEDRPAEKTVEQRIEEMVADGCSMTELEMMFPSVPVATIREIFDRYQDA